MTATDSDAIKWAAQVVTFYRPNFWGAEDDDQLLANVAKDPRRFFTRLLSSVHATGLGYVELCFPPGDWKTALRAFGSVGGLVKALDHLHLKLSGSYQNGWILEQGMENPKIEREILDDARQHAEFLAACGADIMLSGPPRRGVMESSIRARVSDGSMEKTADMMTKLGEITQQFGVRLAIHTEAYSCVAREEDIDRVMDLTDPTLVHLCPDTGHISLDGGNPVNILAKHSERVTSMHWKDCIGERTDIPAHGVVSHQQMMEQFRLMGQGEVDWNGLIQVLRDKQFSGFAAAEIDCAADPVGATRDIVDYFESQLSDIYR